MYATQTQQGRLVHTGLVPGLTAHTFHSSNAHTHTDTHRHTQKIWLLFQKQNKEIRLSERRFGQSVRCHVWAASERQDQDPALRLSPWLPLIPLLSADFSIPLDHQRRHKMEGKSQSSKEPGAQFQPGQARQAGGTTDPRTIQKKTIPCLKPSVALENHVTWLLSIKAAAPGCYRNRY